MELLSTHRISTAIVFTTAYDQYAVTAFELNAADYLLKPFRHARFDAAVEQATQRAPVRLERILVRDRGCIFPLALNEIAYLKADSKYTAIAARGQTRPASSACTARRW